MSSANYTRAAAMFGQNPIFRAFLAARSGRYVDTVEEAAKEIRLACDVLSRSALNKDFEARKRWESLVSEFNRYMSASRRGV
jgi:hypothetical protein